ncbi:PHA/PHB synthase family protein [Pseudoroseicyclus aestuarii]|uniref:Polyhydroxyalkanoate synthase n=1 Tax=Pseudoroseicyclus aestuarii TaxID=1795041 RepID=A0A318SUC7_9RHOB|nr:class I poly(R)-hydroxyalkanoic acid synthase [Pseudoroseicyclus aestuarii]PYE83856.1 polyhydroxyalkanoate synthase [Pseudoroseicyclus aestuarii]
MAIEGPSEDTGDASAQAEARIAADTARIKALTRRLRAAMEGAAPPPGARQAGDLLARAAGLWWGEALKGEGRVAQPQIEAWGRVLTAVAEAQRQAAGGAMPEDRPRPRRDKRFSNPLWDSHPWYRLARETWEATGDAIEAAARDLPGLSAADRARLLFFARQLIDMMAPGNFLATNPDAMERAVETGGQSLIDGLENLVRDAEAHGPAPLVTLSDPGAYEIGRNIALTPGEVVLRTPLFELIQYAPATAAVHEVPLLIFPPWINRYYILDLRPENSLVRWLVGQGFTVFMVSWKNPDPSYADVSLSDYVTDGFLRAIEAVRAICGTREVNAVGYCIAGTLLAATLGVLARRGDTSVASASFLAALTDFSDPGDLAMFLTDDMLGAIEAEVDRRGILDGRHMARTFAMLRANELIWRPAIRSYMLGKAPPAFDLLHWNGDSTNLPARMAVEYLRLLCREDRLAGQGLEIAEQVVRLSDVQVPRFTVACEGDHIVPWRASYSGTRAMGGAEVRFVLARSGHIAGIVNPPAQGKYGYWAAPQDPAEAEAWKEAAAPGEGSWWPLWRDWLAGRSGAQVSARQPGSEGFPPLCPAPGTYLRER